MTTTATRRAEFDGDDPRATQPSEDKTVPWGTIGKELLNRELDTLKETLEGRLSPPHHVSRESLRGAIVFDPTLQNDLLELLAVGEPVKTLDAAIETIRDPEGAFRTLLEEKPELIRRAALERREVVEEEHSSTPAKRDGGRTPAEIRAAEDEELTEVAALFLDVGARQNLQSCFRSAAASHEEITLLVAYLYARFLRIWEDTSDWSGIRKVMGVSKSALKKVEASLDKHTKHVLDELMCLIECIDAAMEVESGLNCSCPVTMGDGAERVIKVVTPLLAESGTSSSSDAEEVLTRAKSLLERGLGPPVDCSAFVRQRAAIDIVYFSSIGTVSGTVFDHYVYAQASAYSQISDAIEDLKTNETLLKGDVYQSELRSHRLGLESLREAWPRLHVDKANVIYCYPFAVPWADPVSLIEAAQMCTEEPEETQDEGAEVASEGEQRADTKHRHDGHKGHHHRHKPHQTEPKVEKRQKWRFNGATASVSDIVLTDMWDGAAESDADLFSGVAFRFSGARPLVKMMAPKILHDKGRLKDEEGKEIDPAQFDISFDLEVRLSRIGNHYVRLQFWLNDASIHELNQAMRRAMEQMGDETVIFGNEDHTWERLYDFAHDLIDSLVEHLEDAVILNELGDELSHENSKAAEDGRSRKSYPHVIMTARQLSLEQLAFEDGGSGYAYESDLSFDELAAAKGIALLVQPVRQAAAVLEEWCRYATPDLSNDPGVMQPLSFDGNFAYRTTNTTCGLLRGTPEFLIKEHEEMAQFVASLPVLLESWMGQIRKRAIPSLNEDETVSDITEKQLELRKLLTKATTVIAKIRSPDLCLTAVHRNYLDHMCDTAGIDTLEDELQSHFTVLDAHLNTLSTMAAKREQRRQGIQEFFFGAGAVLVGVPSLAALFALLDTGVNKQGTFDIAEFTILAIGVLVLIYFVCSLPGAAEFARAVKKWAHARLARVRRAFGIGGVRSPAKVSDHYAKRPSG